MVGRYAAGRNVMGMVGVCSVHADISHAKYRISSGRIEGVTIQKRGRGRPKGSKNKKTLEREAAEAASGKQIKHNH